MTPVAAWAGNIRPATLVRRLWRRFVVPVGRQARRPKGSRSSPLAISRRIPRAHDCPTRPPRTGNQAGQVEDAGPEGLAPAPRRLHARLHDHPEEAELGAAQGRTRAAHLGHRGHRVHPRHRPQPAGALDRARARRSGEGPAGRALQDHPRCARRLRRREPQAGPQPLRREEGRPRCLAKVPRRGAS